MLEVFDLIRSVADTNVPVLIQGASGTGKELVASAVHNEGARSTSLFVPVNCGALPDPLLESELFGHVRGAFTGAIRDKKGRFELADGGTIFLDEIGDVSPAVQVRLLLPATFEEGASERFPVLYLLHGGGGKYTDWTKNTDVGTHTAATDVIVAMPEALVLSIRSTK